MVVVFTITKINLFNGKPIFDLVQPGRCIYLLYYVVWLRYLPCFRHTGKSGYCFPEFIHHILVGARQAELF